MSISLFTGCSFSAGTGFELEKDDPALWINLLHSSHPTLNKTQLINASTPGNSNADIFNDTVFNILTQPDVKYVFVQWSSVPRYNLSLGLEMYNTHQYFIPNTTVQTHNLHNFTYTKNYLQKINDRFIALAHDHHELVKLVYYINSITQLCQLKNCYVFFINGLCTWDHNYFKKLNHVLPSEYTEYTKKLIQVETRDDNEIFALYNKIHDEYDLAGGIQEHVWLNLYSSMKNCTIDRNNDGQHPGINSNQLYCQQFTQALDLKIL
jgi:hypothetical protein